MGYIKLDRGLKNWEWKDKPNMVALWIEILLQANYYDSKWHGKVYEAGSFPTSIAKLSTSTGLTAQQIRTCLNRLKSTNEITIESTSHGTKICVTKWADYQCCGDDNNKQNNKQVNNQLTSNQQTNNNTIRKKEGNKEKNKDNIRHKYGQYMNVLLSDEDMEKLKEEFPADYRDRIERVSEYCASTGKSYKNYLATIRNWAKKDEPSKRTDIVPQYDTNENPQFDEERYNEIMKGRKSE